MSNYTPPITGLEIVELYAKHHKGWRQHLFYDPINCMACAIGICLIDQGERGMNLLWDSYESEAPVDYPTLAELLGWTPAFIDGVIAGNDGFDWETWARPYQRDPLDKVQYEAGYAVGQVVKQTMGRR